MGNGKIFIFKIIWVIKGLRVYLCYIHKIMISFLHLIIKVSTKIRGIGSMPLIMNNVNYGFEPINRQKLQTLLIRMLTIL